MSMNRHLAMSALMAMAGGYGGRIVVDPARGDDQTDVVILGGDPLSIVDYAAPAKPRSVLSEPITFNRNPSDLEALRAAQLRRERKAARQAKGFRHG